MISAPSADDRFNLEVVKLLLKIAWVDREVDEREKHLIMGVARSWNVPEPELKGLLNRLEQGNPLPEPDLALLKTRADDVMTAARALVLSDGKVKKEESALLGARRLAGVTPMTMQTFADEVKQFLAAEGEKRPVSYDPRLERLRVGDGRSLTHFVSLTSLKARYDAIEEPRSRVRVLERDLIAMRWTKPTLEVLARRLFPRLRPKAALASLELKRKVLEHVNGQAAPDLSVASREFNSLFSVQLVFQLSEEAVDVGSDRLQAWGQSFDELMKLSFENLLKVSTEEPREVRPNLWALTGGGGHVAARLLFDDLYEALPFKKNAVAMVPNQNVVLFADKTDDEALTRMAQIGLDASQAPFGLWGMPMQRVGAKWEPWMPEDTRECWLPLKVAALPGEVKLYSAHKELLAAWYEIEGTAMEVSPLLAVQDEGSVFSSAVWQKGSPTMLPPADRCAIVDMSSGDPEAWSVPWGHLERLGAKLEKVEGDLVYFKATGELNFEKVKTYPQVQ